jgi:hypothetical protein
MGAGEGPFKNIHHISERQELKPENEAKLGFCTRHHGHMGSDNSLLGSSVCLVLCRMFSPSLIFTTRFQFQPYPPPTDIPIVTTRSVSKYDQIPHGGHVWPWWWTTEPELGWSGEYPETQTQSELDKEKSIIKVVRVKQGTKSGD